MLELRLLGPPQVSLDNQTVHINRRKSRGLLYYLAAHPHPLHREHLLGVFWPDTPRPAAQQVLRTTLHGLRQMLQTAILVDQDTIGLQTAVHVDVRIFEQQLDSSSIDPQKLASALELYQGDFLEDFSLPDTQSFEDWALIERERYRRMAVRGWTALSAAKTEEGNFNAALASLERALRFNPLQEDLQRESMRLQYLAGDRPGAIRRYDYLRRLLDDEMGVPPMAETRALYDAIITDRISPVPDVQTRLHPRLYHKSTTTPVQRRYSEPAQIIPFTGRQVELNSLKKLINSHRFVLIEGEAGIGKTRLAEEFIRTLEYLIMQGRARELELGLPYQSLIDALRNLMRLPQWNQIYINVQEKLPAVWFAEVSRLLPELSKAVSGAQFSVREADEPRLWEGIHQFIRCIALQQPLLLFLDDIHWADTSTLALLGYLVRQTQDIPLFFLATAHPIPPRSSLAMLVQSLIRENRLSQMVLQRLNADHVLAVAQALSPQNAGLLAEWLLKTSEGNPYILAELVRYAREQQLLRSNGELSEEVISSSIIVPQTVYSLIQSRLGHISEAARRLLDAGVAAGREFEFSVVARASGLSENAALDAIDELVVSGLVQPVDDSHFAFDHTLTMEVAYREVGELRHRLLHRRVAEAIESIYRDRLDSVAGQLAWHYDEGNDYVRASPYALRAARMAANLAAWAEAINFYKMALHPITGSERIPVLLALGDAYRKAGQYPQASDVYREALSLSDPSDTRLAMVQLALARSLILQARFAEVIQLAQNILAMKGLDNAAAAELVWGVALSLEGSDLEDATHHLKAAQALIQAGDHSSLPDLAQIQFELGSVAAQQGNLTEAIAFYRQSLATTLESDQDDIIDLRILAYNNLAYHLLLSGDTSAEEYAQAGLRLSQERGSVGLQPYLFSTLGEITLARDDLPEAEKNFNTGLAIAERLSIPERIAGLTANLGLVAIQQGKTSLAIHRLSTALARASSLGTRHLEAQICIWLAPLLPPEEARLRLSEARAIAESSGRIRLLAEIERLEGAIGTP